MRSAPRVPPVRRSSLRQRLLERERRDDEQDRADEGQEHEDQPPRAEAQQLGADGRGEDRCDADDEHEPGHHLGDREPLVAVADDGHRQDHPGRGAEALHEPQAGEHGDVGGERQSDGHDDVDCQTGQERAASTEGVGDRPDGQLPEREAGQRRGDRQLHGRGGRVQVGGDLGERGEVGVERQRADGGQRGEQEDEADAHTRRGDPGHEGCNRRGPRASSRGVQPSGRGG